LAIGNFSKVLSTSGFFYYWAKGEIKLKSQTEKGVSERTLKRREQERIDRIFWFSEGYMQALKDYGIDPNPFIEKMKIEMEH
jgi:hypothetical protein